MRVWLDAQISPGLAGWLTTEFGVAAVAVRDLGMRDAEDHVICDAARQAADVVVISKDSDFVDFVERHGPPPQIIWLTLGNTSNRRLRETLSHRFEEAMQLIASGEPLVEIREAPRF